MGKLKKMGNKARKKTTKVKQTQTNRKFKANVKTKQKIKKQ